MNGNEFSLKIKQLNEGASILEHKHEIEGLVKSVLNIDETHPLFNDFVTKLCNKYGISLDTSYEDAIDDVEIFLTNILGVGIRPFNEFADISTFAKQIVDTVKNRGKLTMAQLKKLASDNGFVIMIKSVSKLVNIIKKNLLTNVFENDMKYIIENV